MGPPVMAAAFTTAATGTVMFGCQILFYLKFGVILLFSMLYSLLTTLFFFLAVTNLCGPEKQGGKPMAVELS